MLNQTKILIILSLVVSIFSLIALAFNQNYLFLGVSSSYPVKFINKQEVLQSQYDQYLNNYFDKEFHRTIDKQNNGITTSEGQSYTMLRSVWMNDQDTFDKTWQWTQNNLQRNDKLFSWKWGLREDGVWGILDDIGGQNVATDADIDISLSLVFASKIWNKKNYLEEAKSIINSIWQKTVVKINGNYLLLPNDLEKTASKDYYLINPSYFSPAHYRIFAKIDSNNHWNKLADDSYKFLEAFHTHKISNNDQPKLPPNWIILNKTELTISEPEDKNLNTNFGFDALRIPFRIGLDWQWHHKKQAKDYLSLFEELNQSWNQHSKIFAEYSRYGNNIVDYETHAMYGGTLSYFTIHQPNIAKQL
ncbi:MAG: hypothetical protein HC932_04020 [Thermales bacterium]|nr:hypothetical protein [Thermales bacterium]